MDATSNVVSNVDGQRAKIQLGGAGCAWYPTPARFLPLFSLLKTKLALKASQRTVRSISFLFQTSVSVNLGSEGSRMRFRGRSAGNGGHW